MLRMRDVLVGMLMLGCCLASRAQDAQQIVRQAVRTELAADAADHSRWIYYEVDRRPDASVEQWVADTGQGTLKRVIEQDGRSMTKAQQRNKMNAFIGDTAAQATQQKSGQHDDQQATQMLSMLPQAFVWTKSGERGGDTVLQFRPNPQFHPPTWEARVFAAMAGEMTVNNKQHRIVSLKGRMIHDVNFWGGLLGHLQAGGTFDVERRELAPGIWQIVQTHVHIEGHALIFKSISEEEDDDKSKFKELPANVSLASAEKMLLTEKG